MVWFPFHSCEPSCLLPVNSNISYYSGPKKGPCRNFQNPNTIPSIRGLLPGHQTKVQVMNYSSLTVQSNKPNNLLLIATL